MVVIVVPGQGKPPYSVRNEAMNVTSVVAVPDVKESTVEEGVILEDPNDWHDVAVWLIASKRQRLYACWLKMED